MSATLGSLGSLFGRRAEVEFVPEDDLKERRLRARQLLAGAADTSPIQHWTQGAARVLGGFNGALENYFAARDAQSNSEAAQKALAGVFGGGQPASQTIDITPQSAKPETPAAPAMTRYQRAVAMLDPRIRDGITATAGALGIDPVDLGTAISYETGGTFDPTKRGPTTQWGQHRGLIQFGEPQARQHGVDWNDPIGSQLGPNGAVANYLRSTGVKPGMGLLDIYSAINAGGVGRYGRTDENNGGAPGTVRDKVENQMAGHREKAMALLGVQTASASPRNVANDASPIGAPAVGQASGNPWAAMTPAAVEALRRPDAPQPAQAAQVAPSASTQPAMLQSAQQPSAIPPNAVQERGQRAMQLMMSPAYQYLPPGAQAAVKLAAEQGFKTDAPINMQAITHGNRTGFFNPRTGQTTYTGEVPRDPQEVESVRLRNEGAALDNAAKRESAKRSDMETQTVNGQVFERAKGTNEAWKPAPGLPSAVAAPKFRELNGRVFQEMPDGTLQDRTPAAATTGYTPMTPDQRRSFNVPDGTPAFMGPDGKPQFGPASRAEQGQFRKEADKEMAGYFKTHADGGGAAANVMQETELLREVVAGAPQGPVSGRIATAFPGLSTNADVFNSRVKSIAPQLRVPGSGATSDKDLDTFMAALPQLRNTPEANQAILGMVEAKARINLERSEVARSALRGEIDPAEADKRIRALDQRSVLTPDIRKALGIKGEATQQRRDQPSGNRTKSGITWSVN